jgi:hypothetical protein
MQRGSLKVIFTNPGLLGLRQGLWPGLEIRDIFRRWILMIWGYKMDALPHQGSNHYYRTCVLDVVKETASTHM